MNTQPVSSKPSKTYLTLPDFMIGSLMPAKSRRVQNFGLEGTLGFCLFSFCLEEYPPHDAKLFAVADPVRPQPNPPSAVFHQPDPH